MRYDGIDLENISNIYPSVLVRHQDVMTTVSIEWYEQNKDQLQLESYTLIFLDTKGNRIERHFQSYEEMIDSMREVVRLLKK